MQRKIHQQILNSIYPLTYCWKIDKWYLILVIFSSVSTSCLNIFNIFVLKFLTEAVINYNKRYFITTIGIMISLIILVNLLNMIANYKLEPFMRNHINKRIQEDIYSKSFDYSISDFDNKNFFDLYYFVLENSKDTIINMITQFSSFLTSLLSIGGVGSLVLRYDIFTIFIVIIGIIISTLLSLNIQKIQYKFKLDTIPSLRRIKYIDRIFYLVDYVKEIKTYKNSNLIPCSYDDSWKCMDNVTHNWIGKIGRNTFSLNMIDSLTYISILFHLGIQTIKRNISLSVFMVVFNGSQQLVAQVKSIVETVPNIYYNSINLEKYFEYMEYNQERENEKLNGKIEKIFIKNISFRYDEKDKEVLKSISLSINKTEKIAIVGRNGSGKSTLIKLILGLYNPTQGNIEVNNIGLNKLDLDDYRDKVSIVYQDFRLFAFTIAQNIMMKYEINKEDELIIMEALKQVNLYDKIMKLPNGINTVFSKEFDENGIVFSGGEMQRLALARVYAKKSDIIIMDEPFSSFDAITEKDIFEVLNKISKEKILIFITHSLANLSKFDKIIVMDNGEIIESGTHSELIENNSMYYSMIEMQKNKYN